MTKKIYLLPGFGEDAFVFDMLRQHFDDYKLIDVNYRTSLDKIVFSEIDVWNFCKVLIQEYDIKKDDILFGHSMGGYFSFVIRELVSCEIVMIASFSDPNKVKRQIYNKNFNLSLAKLGLLGTTFFQNLMLKPSKGKYFHEALKRVIRNFSNFSKSQITKMLKLSFGEPIDSSLKNPLRVHAKNDKVVRVPDEDYQECKLGHFCLILEDDVVAEIIFKNSTFIK